METPTALNNIIKALEAKGVSFELNGECSRLEWYDDKSKTYSGGTFYGVELGISIKSGIWVWFDYRELSTTGEFYYFFKQRYNANIGTAIKGFTTGRKETKKIEQLLNITF